MTRWNPATMWSLEPEPLDPETEARMGALVERLAGEAVRRRLALPALLVLETGKPLAFAGSQALVFLEPLVRAFLNPSDYDLFVKLLEDRRQVERLIQALEAREEARLAGGEGPSSRDPKGGDP